MAATCITLLYVSYEAVTAKKIHGKVRRRTNETPLADYYLRQVYADARFVFTQFGCANYEATTALETPEPRKQMNGGEKCAVTSGKIYFRSSAFLAADRPPFWKF